MTERRPYYNPKTRKLKVMTEEEARKLNEEEAKKQKKSTKRR